MGKVCFLRCHQYFIRIYGFALFRMSKTIRPPGLHRAISSCSNVIALSWVEIFKSVFNRKTISSVWLLKGRWYMSVRTSRVPEILLSRKICCASLNSAIDQSAPNSLASSLTCRAAKNKPFPQPTSKILPAHPSANSPALFLIRVVSVPRKAFLRVT